MTDPSRVPSNKNQENPNPLDELGIRREHIIAIKEAADCSDDERLIQEFNSGIYCFNTAHLIDSIQHLSSNNQQSEYYLTDIIELLSKKKHTIAGYCIKNPIEVSGANTQTELKALENHLVS